RRAQRRRRAHRTGRQAVVPRDGEGGRQRPGRRADAGREVNERGNQMIPAQLVEQLSTALARGDGRGPSDDDTLEAGEALADGDRERLCTQGGKLSLRRR